MRSSSCGIPLAAYSVRHLACGGYGMRSVRPILRRLRHLVRAAHDGRLSRDTAWPEERGVGMGPASAPPPPLGFKTVPCGANHVESRRHTVSLHPVTTLVGTPNPSTSSPHQ